MRMWMRQDTRYIKWNISGEGLSSKSIANYILRLVMPSQLPLPRPRSSTFGKSWSPLTASICLGLLNLCQDSKMTSFLNLTILRMFARNFLISLWQRYKRSGQSLTHLSQDESSDILPDEVACFSRPLTSFRPTSAEEILQIMTHMTKTCDLDPLPARQHKQCFSP